jgi:hypothetical protein
VGTDRPLPGPYYRRRWYVSDFAADGAFIPDLVGAHRDKARAKQAERAREAWAPHHPETEPIWLPLRLIIEKVVSYSEVQGLTLEAMADLLEALQVTADVERYHRRGDADG